MANVQSDHVPSAAVGAFRNFTATKAKGKKELLLHLDLDKIGILNKCLFSLFES